MTSTWTRGALLCAAFFFSGCRGEPVPSADLVARGGFVYTVNDEQPTAGAIAVRGENIVFVGSDDEVAAYVGPETRVVELEGRMLMPGIVDAHVHPIGGSLKNLYQCNFPFSATPGEIQAKVAECVAQQSPCRSDPCVPGVALVRHRLPIARPETLERIGHDDPVEELHALVAELPWHPQSQRAAERER